MKRIPTVSVKHVSEGNAKNTQNINPSQIKGISDYIAKNLDSNNNILSLFPDIKLAIDNLVSAILNPNDLMTSNPIINIDNDIHKNVMSSSFNMEVEKKVQDYINNTFNLSEMLETILKKSLITEGAYVTLVLPQSSIADIALESIDTEDDVTKMNDKLVEYYNKQNLNSSIINEHHVSGKLKIGLESNDAHVFRDISVDDLNEDIFIDSPEIMALESIKNTKKRTKRINRGKKSIDPTKFTKLSDKMETENTTRLLSIKESAYKNKGRPITMVIDPRAAIPITSNTNPEKHLDYLIIIDTETGSPITGNDVRLIDEKKENAARFINAPAERENRAQKLISKASAMLTNQEAKAPIINNMEAIYNAVLESKVANTLKNNEYGELSATDSEFINNIFFSRMLKGKGTKLLYVPKEQVSYIAFNYRNNGTGKSLMEDMTVIASMRAGVYFTKVASYMKNSIPFIKYNVQLDNNNPDFESQKHAVISNVMNMDTTPLLFNTTGLGGYVEFMKVANTYFQFTHENAPDYKIDREVVNNDFKIPDDEVSDMLQEQLLMILSQTKELVLSSKDENFATSIMSKSTMFAKRAISEQKKYVPQISELIQKLVYNHGDLTNEIIDSMIKDKGFKNYIKEEYKINTKGVSEDDLKEMALMYLETYVSNIKVDLPQAMFENEDEKETRFSNMSSRIDDLFDNVMIEYIVNEDALDAVGGLERFKAKFKFVKLCEWCIANDYLTDVVNSLYNFDTAKENIELDEVLHRAYGITSEMSDKMLNFNKKERSNDRKVSKKIENLDNEEDPEENGEGDTSTAEDGTGEEPTNPDDITGEEPDNLNNE